MKKYYLLPEIISEQRDIILALKSELDRLRVVALPEITEEITEELHSTCLLSQPGYPTIFSPWSWTQDAVDFVGILKKARGA
jgi:hypothetical protein